MPDLTCPHCDHKSPDWLMSSHWCAWYVWREGDDERFARTWTGSTAGDAARNWAFHAGDASRFLCDYPTSEIIVLVRRQRSDEVMRIAIRGHWQPTYEIYPQGPAVRSPRAT